MQTRALVAAFFATTGLLTVSPAAADIGTTLLFWGNAAVQYPYGSGPLLRTEPLADAKYRITGKVNLVNTSSVTLDVSCTTSLNTTSDLERVSVPATRNGVSSRLALLMEFVGPNGTTADKQRAELSCTCDGSQCTALGFEGLGIITEAVADDSGNVQVQAAPGT
jgi:hypothetical protein